MHSPPWLEYLLTKWLPGWVIGVLFFAMVSYILFALVALRHILFDIDDEQTANPGRQASGKERGFWRWVFLCSLASNFAVFFISFGAPYVDYDDSPIRAAISVGVLFSTMLFGFFVGPFFFQRLGWLAILSWVLATVSVINEWLPVF